MLTFSSYDRFYGFPSVRRRFSKPPTREKKMAPLLKKTKPKPKLTSRQPEVLGGITCGRKDGPSNTLFVAKNCCPRAWLLLNTQKEKQYQLFTVLGICEMLIFFCLIRWSRDISTSFSRFALARFVCCFFYYSLYFCCSATRLI